MTNKKLSASEEFKAIEEMASLLPGHVRKIPRQEINNLLKRHYGFFLPKNCYVSIPSAGEDYGNLHLNISNSKVGKLRLDAIINAQYFKHLAIGDWNEDGESRSVRFVFSVK